MNLKKCTAVVPCALISALAITASIVSAQDTQNQQSPATSAAHERTIQGVWRTAVTPRNCQLRATLELGAGGDTFASRSAIEILDVNGAVIGAGCAAAVGTRFE